MTALARQLRIGLWVGLVLAAGLGLWQSAGYLLESREPLSKEQIAALRDPQTMAQAARQVGRQRIEAAVPYLDEILTSQQETDRLAAAWALGRIATPRAVRRLQRRVEDPSPAVRAEIATALGRAGSSADDQAFRRLLEDSELAVRAAAVAAIRPLDPARHPGRPDLEAIGAAVRSEHASMRIAAVKAAIRLDGPVAFEILSRASGDADSSVQAAALEAAEQRKRDMLASAIRFLSGPADPVQRLGAARILGRAGTPATARALLGVLDGMDSDDDPQRFASTRKIVIESLAAMGPAAVEPIVRAAAEGEMGPEAERAAAEACVEIGPASADAITRAILAWKIFPDPQELRIWVAALGQVGGVDSIPALSRALGQDVEGMEALVSQAHRQICRRTGKDLPAPEPEAGLLAEAPGPLAWQALRKGHVAVTPYKPDPRAIPDDGVVRLALDKALTWSDRPGRKGSFELELELLRQKGQWSDRFFANSMKFSKRAHEGRIQQVSSQPDRILLDVEVAFDNDLWRSAAFGRYRIELRTGGAELTATYQRFCNEEPVSGSVEVSAWPVERPQADIPPLQPGEHPRLLMRPMDLAAVGERARTQTGRRIVQALRARLARSKQLYKTDLNYVTNWQSGIDAAIGHAFLATLFDDPAHGHRAVELIMPRTFTPPYRGEHGERWPEPLARYPFAVDLAWQWFSPDQRRKVLVSRAHMQMEFSRTQGPLGVFAVTRGVYCVPGTTALLLLDEKGPSWINTPPEPPEVVELPARKDLLETPGLPVMTFQPGKPLGPWLIAGPFRASESARKRLKPQLQSGHFALGDRLDTPEGPAEFRPLSEDALGGIEGLKTAQKILFIPGGQRDSLSVLYALIRAEKPTAFALPSPRQFGSRDNRIWIDGQAIDFGKIVALAPGLHSIALEVQGRTLMPYFHNYRLGYARARHLRYQWELDKWQAEQDDYKQTGRMVDMPYILQRCIVGTRISMRQGLDGPKGKARKHGTYGGSIQWPFISAMWIATGRGLWPDTPIILAEGTDQARPENVSDRMVCFAMGLAPQPVRTQLAREFDRRFAGDRIHRLDCLELIGALVHYPHQPESQAPAAGTAGP